MIGIKAKGNRGVSLAIIVARVFVGACLVLPFFASLLPLTASAAGVSSAMACCAGRPGHCHSGLLPKRYTQSRLNQALQTVNVTNRRFLLDSANTFGGTHFAEPRQIYVELRYRFHY